MKLLYKPFAIVFGVLGGMLASRLFDALWGLIDKEGPPDPNVRRTSWTKVLGAAAVEGLTFQVTKAAVDRAGARGFERLTGVWPGPEETEEE